MAELTIRPEDIREALERFVEAYEPGAAATEAVGVVVECGDGIARVSGLPSARRARRSPRSGSRSRTPGR